MRYFALLVILLSTFAHAQLDIDTVLNSKQLPHRNKNHCAVTPSQEYPCTHLTYDGIQFFVGYDADSHHVKYLSTRDKNFKTEDNLHVGDWVELQENQMFMIDGWKIFGPKTIDGWRIVLGDALIGSRIVILADGTTVDFTEPHKAPLKAGKVRIVELEKGGI